MWDFTCPDTLAPSHFPKTSVLAGAVASQAEARKIAKYENFFHFHKFIPVAVETLGVWGPGALELVFALGRRLSKLSNVKREVFFLRQRLDIAVQRGNALFVLGTFPSAFAAGDVCLFDWDG